MSILTRKLKCTDNFAKVIFNLCDMVYYTNIEDSIILASFKTMEYHLLDESSVVFFNSILTYKKFNSAVLYLEEYFEVEKKIFLTDLINWCNDMIDKKIMSIKFK